MGEVDLVKLLSASKGIVLGVVILLLSLVAICFFVIAYKIIHISQAESPSIKFLDKFVDDHGPFDSILGYSQGGAMIPIPTGDSHSFSPVVARYAESFPSPAPWNTRLPAVESTPPLNTSS